MPLNETSWRPINFTLSQPSRPEATPASKTVQDAVILGCHLVTVLVALLGNSLVCKTIISRKSMRNSVTNILIANLSISDILGSLVILFQWVFCAQPVIESMPIPVGDRICSVLKALQVLSYYVSTFTMTTIAVDRYFLVKTPLKPRIQFKLWIIFVWLFSLMFASQLLFSVKLSIYFTSATNLIDCKVAFGFSSSLLFRKARVSVLVLTQYAIPLTVTGILYTMTIRMISHRGSIGEVTATQLQTLDRSKRTTIRMLMIVVIVFAVCWFPVHVLHLIDFFVVPLSQGQCNSSGFYVACYWLGISSCCWNPFIYCWLNSDFRRDFRRVVCFFEKRTRSQSIGSHVPLHSKGSAIFYINS